MGQVEGTGALLPAVEGYRMRKRMQQEGKVQRKRMQQGASKVCRGRESVKG